MCQVRASRGWIFAPRQVPLYGAVECIMFYTKIRIQDFHVNIVTPQVGLRCPAVTAVNFFRTGYYYLVRNHLTGSKFDTLLVEGY